MRNHSFTDLSPKKSSFLGDLHEGLNKEQKSISPKYFYDEKGSQLFDEICELEEYYPTRTELSILERVSKELSSYIDEGTNLIEYGSGSSLKIKLLLDHCKKINSYTALDISKEHLISSTKKLAEKYTELEIEAIYADYMELDVSHFNARKNKMVFFPGSTIGNLERQDAEKLLKSTREIVGDKGYALIGIDLQKILKFLKKPTMIEKV